MARLKLLVLPLWLLTFAPLTAAEAPPAGYSFKLNGKAIQPTILSLAATPDRPQPGDLVLIDDLALVLGEERDFDLRTTPREDGRLLAKGKDGKTRVIGVTVGWTFEGEKRVMLDPLAKLTEEEVRDLRGVRLDEWTVEAAEKIKKLDPRRACLTVTENVAKKGGALPPLPPSLEYLVIDERSNRGIRDYGQLKELAALKCLRVHGWTVPFDCALLRQAGQLRYVDLGGSAVRNVGDLAGLKQVRFLGLGFSRGADTVAFAAEMASLIELDVQRTAVSDLSPLGGLKALASINANGAPVRKLPGDELPALRQLRVMSTQLADEEVAAFAKAHPRCQVLFRWEEALRKALKDADRIRVRSGGTCHRDLRGEKTLFEEKGADRVAKLVASIRIEEKRSGFHCMCCGEPSFEFYQGGRLLLTLGFHHGRSVRWPDVWPGDGALTDASADYLCRWLADNGYKNALEQRETRKRRAAAARRLQEKYARLLPEAVVKGLKAAGSEEEAAKAFDSGVPDGVARAALGLRLLGCADGSWNHAAKLDDLVKKAVLPKVKKDDLAAALAKASDAETLNGAGRWLFGEGRWKDLDEKTRKAVLPAVARHALGNPRVLNRRRTLAALGELPEGGGKPLLRAVLNGEIKVRTLAPEDEEEPGGWVTVSPGDDELTAGSDAAFAGLQLAKLGDRSALPALRRLAEKATGADKKRLSQAIELLDRKP